MAERKKELLDRALIYFAREGASGITLRPLAKALGTSARLLVYHFESKEKLLEAVGAEVQARFRASFRGSFQQNPSTGLRAFWEWISREPNLGYYRLMLEAQLIDRPNSNSKERPDEESTRWLELIQSVLPEKARSPARASLCAAVVDGLLVELLTTGNHARTTAALRDFSALLHSSRRASPRAARPNSGLRKAAK